MFSNFLNIPLITVSFSGSTPPTLVFDNTKYHHGEHIWTTRCLPVSHSKKGFSYETVFKFHENPQGEPRKREETRKPPSLGPWVARWADATTKATKKNLLGLWMGTWWEHEQKKWWEKRREMLWWDYHGDVKLTMMDFSTENNWYEWGNWYLTIQNLGNWECKHHPKGLFTNKTGDIEELTLQLTYTLPLGLA